MVKIDKYEVLREKKATLRLYLHDPQLQEIFKTKAPVEITLEGKMVVAKNPETRTRHIFFAHNNPDFIPVFIDYEGDF